MRRQELPARRATRPWGGCPSVTAILAVSARAGRHTGATPEGPISVETRLAASGWEPFRRTGGEARRGKPPSLQSIGYLGTALG